MIQTQTTTGRHSAVGRPPGQGRRVTCLAVASGKGGVGKTFVAVNLALALAKLNRRVLLIDADLGLANADILLGVNPTHSLQDALRHGLNLRDIVVTTDYGVDLLPASSGSRDLVNLGGTRLNSLAAEMLGLAAGYEALIFDCASGIDGQVTAFVAAAPQTVAVTTALPTALVDVYALIKVIKQERLAPDVGVIVNMVQDERLAERAQANLLKVTRDYLGMSVQALGFIPFSEAVGQAVHRRRPLLAGAPSDDAAVRLNQIAKSLLQKQQGSTPLSDLDWTGLLDGLLAPDGNGTTPSRARQQTPAGRLDVTPAGNPVPGKPQG